MPYMNGIFALLDKLAPASLLTVMPDAEAVFSGYLQQHPTIDFAALTGSELLSSDFHKRYRLALVDNTLEYMRKQDGAALIAKLRDIHAEILYVIIPTGPGWTNLQTTWNAADMIALGLRQDARYGPDDKGKQLYHFDIYDYKITPDWLNSQHWSNPQMWNKARW